MVTLHWQQASSVVRPGGYVHASAIWDTFTSPRANLIKQLGYFEKVLSLSNTNNENVFLALESIAQVHLAQGYPQKCLQFVDVPDESANGVGKYTHRYAQLTKAKILGRLGRWEESDQFVARTLSLAREAQDPVLTTIASMFQAEVLLHRGRKDESWDLITNVLPTLPRCPPDMLARYERILACLLAAYRC